MEHRLPAPRQLGHDWVYWACTITDGSPVYMANPYFVAKVVDNGSSGASGPDTIAVFVDDVIQNCSDDPGNIHVDVTSGNLTVHKG